MLDHRYHIVICDDEMDSIENIKYIIERSMTDKVEIDYYEYLSAVDFLNDVSGIKEIDLVIFDVEMQDVDGYEAARRFRNIYPDVLLVFFSGYHIFNARSYKSNPYRYLLKGDKLADNILEMKEVFQEIDKRRNNDHIIGKCYNKIYAFRLEDVIYFENYRRGSLIHSIKYPEGYKKGVRYLTQFKVDELECRYSKEGFFLISSRILLNVSYVRFIAANGKITLENDEQLTIARNRLNDVKKNMVSFLSEKR